MADEGSKSRVDGLLTRIGQSLPAPASVGRVFKYGFLLVALMLTIKVTFDGFSAYLARRSLDAELEAKKISSLEYLRVLARRERAFVIDTVETRCMERNQLASFRALDAATRAEIEQAYAASRALRDRFVEVMDKLPPGQTEWAKFVDVKQIAADVRANFAFSFAVNLSDYGLKPAQGVRRDDPNFRKTVVEISDWLAQDAEAKKYLDQLAQYKKAVAFAREKIGNDSAYFKNIDLLERRLKRLAEVRKLNQEKLGGSGYDDVMARYAIWRQALTGQVGNVDDDPTLDEAAFQLASEDKQSLPDVDCSRFEAYFAKVTGQRINVGHSTTSPAGPSSASTVSLGGAIYANVSFLLARYRGMLVYFFTIPPIAQTLLGTLFLGALGAMATNTLRMSNFGWWGTQPEPLWGELLLAPFVGSLAAFGVFLLGSTGLLFTGETKSGGAITTLSPFFIGLLGFISGLVYDDAFLRVRRVARRIFAGDPTTSGAAPEDAALAETLRVAKAGYAGDLVLRFGIGKRIATDSEFTLLIPSDEVMLGMTMQAWKEISDFATRAKFEDWFRHHHAAKRVTTANVRSNAVAAIELGDGTKIPLAVQDDVLAVDGAKVAQADITWGNGIIHILSKDVH